jgi:hypothetical protein
MDFEKRLERAIERGHRASNAKAAEAAQQAVSEAEFKRLHSQYRLELSDYIENYLKWMPEHFPGFRFETVHGDRGWGAAVSRDDVARGQSGRENLFSRLQMTIRPFSRYHVLELAAKGTIRNKEIYDRTHYQQLTEVDLDSMREIIDLWILEYAEQYAARRS